MSRFMVELRLALASLRRAPGFFLTVITTLGITLGALVCVFGINKLVFLEPLPYPEQKRLFSVQGVVLEKGVEANRGLMNYPGLSLLYKQPDVFERAALLNYQRHFLTSDPLQPRLNILYASSGVFDITAARMRLGRGFQQTEDVGAKNAVAVLSHQIWQTQFGADPQIIGKKITLDNVGYTVIGVLAQDYQEAQIHTIGRDSDIWLPWEMNSRDEKARQDWENFDSNLMMVGRLKAGVSVAQAEAALGEPLNKRFREQTTGIAAMASVGLAIGLESFSDAISGQSKGIAIMLFIGVAALLLIASANVSNLFLARTAQKQRQLSIQATLGANRGHLFQNMFAEALILMTSAAVVAMVVAVFGMAALQSGASGSLPRMEELTLDLAGVVFVLLVALLLALVFAGLSIRMVNYRALSTVLQSGGKGSGMQISRTTRNVLIASQITVASLLLLVNFGLFKESLSVLNRPSGFVAKDLFEINLLSGQQELSPEQMAQKRQAVNDKLLTLPQVAAVSFVNDGPTATVMVASSLRKDVGSEEKITASANRVDERYFPMIQLPFAEGRNYNAGEVRDKAPVIIINETMARALNPSGSALGTKLFYNKNNEPYTVVGVVKDIFLPTVRPRSRVYLPGTSNLNFVVQVKPGQVLDKASVVSMLSQVDTNLYVARLVSSEQGYGRLLGRDVTTAGVTCLLALLALFLAGVGVYGVLSYSIKLRRHELGIRMSIGAPPNKIMALVYRDSFIPVLWGVGVSTTLTIILFVIARPLMEGGLHIGPIPALITLVLILGSAALACYLPLRGIVSKWPIQSLRGDATI